MVHVQIKVVTMYEANKFSIFLICLEFLRMIVAKILYLTVNLLHCFVILC